MLETIRSYVTRLREETQSAHEPPSVSKNGIGEPTAGPAWIGVDLDGTLAWHEEGDPLAEIGPPVAPMIERVRQLLAEGWRIKIFTARAAFPRQMVLIQQWLRRHGLPPLEITNAKDFGMVRLYDDRCVQVEPNTGRIITDNALEGKDSFGK